MEWSTGVSDPLVAEVPYGDLMMMVDMTNRWVYKGSVTTPPCARFVYWNVVK
jgi:carbonic anhydrase